MDIVSVHIGDKYGPEYERIPREKVIGAITIIWIREEPYDDRR